MKQIDPKLLSIAFTDKNLCTRCGTCVGVCPTNALSLDSNLYPTIDPEKCTECGLCAQTCPGGSVPYTALAESTFGHAVSSDSFDGHVQETFVAHAADPDMRQGGAGGGVITALLWDMLKHGDIDGAVVTRMNRERPWIGEPFIARTREDLLASQGSRYLIIPLNAIWQELRDQPGKFAYAALPCHVHGFRLAAPKVPHVREKIHAVVGLFCGGGMEPYIVPELLRMKGLRTDDIADFQFRGGDWPGKIRAILKDGSIRNMHYSDYKDGAYNYFTGLYMPRRCQTCIDGSGEFADLSVSDAWTRDERGEYKFRARSRILVRTDRGREIVDRARRRGTVIAEDVSTDPAYRTHKAQTKRKGAIAPLRVARLHRQGKPAPVYDRVAPPATAIDHVKERAVSLILWLGRYWGFRYPLLKFLMSKYAIPLIKIRQWRKKWKYRLRRP